MSKKKQKKAPDLHPDLKGLDIQIDAFGNIKGTLNVETINAFLNKNVDDIKLSERDDFESLTGKESENRKLRKKRTNKSE